MNMSRTRRGEWRRRRPRSWKGTGRKRKGGTDDKVMPSPLPIVFFCSVSVPLIFYFSLLFSAFALNSILTTITVQVWRGRARRRMRGNASQIRMEMVRQSSSNFLWCLILECFRRNYTTTNRRRRLHPDFIFCPSSRNRRSRDHQRHSFATSRSAPSHSPLQNVTSSPPQTTAPRLLSSRTNGVSEASGDGSEIPSPRDVHSILSYLSMTLSSAAQFVGSNGRRGVIPSNASSSSPYMGVGSKDGNTIAATDISTLSTNSKSIQTPAPTSLSYPLIPERQTPITRPFLSSTATPSVSSPPKSMAELWMAKVEASNSGLAKETRPAMELKKIKGLIRDQRRWLNGVWRGLAWIWVRRGRKG
jgi:hypothetical protein